MKRQRHLAVLVLIVGTAIACERSAPATSARAAPPAGPELQPPRAPAAIPTDTLPLDAPSTGLTVKRAAVDPSCLSAGLSTVR